MKHLPIKIKAENDAVIPTYNNSGDSGFDLIATNFKYYDKNTSSIKKYEGANKIVIIPGGKILVGTDLYMSIPEGYELQIRSRSGNTLKKGYVVGNSPGTVDASYRGEIGVIIQNTSADVLMISIGDKVAQGVIAEVTKADFTLVDELDGTTRGDKGYGSTDKK